MLESTDSQEICMSKTKRKKSTNLDILPNFQTKLDVISFRHAKRSDSYTFLDYIYFRHEAHCLVKLIFEWVVSS